MPVKKVRGGWSFGGGSHKTKAGAERSYRAYRAKKGKKKR